MEGRMDSTLVVDHRDVHVSPLILYTTYTDKETLDTTQAIGGRDRSRESSEAKRDDRHLERGKPLPSTLWTCTDDRRNSSTLRDVCGEL